MNGTKKLLSRWVKKYLIPYYWLFVLGFFILFSVIYLYFSPFTLSSGHLSNISSLLNSNVQWLSAVFGIVISLSLIAVQLAAQNYSPRIITMYVRHYLFWTIIAQFAVAILYNLILLNNLTDFINLKLSDISIFISGICLLSLVPHIYNTFEQLKPETVVLSLCNEIDENYVALLERHWRGRIAGSALPEEVNPLFVIENILEKSDIATVAKALSNIRARFCGVINKNNCEVLSYHFARFFSRLGNNAIDVQNEEASSLIIRHMFTISQYLRKEGLEINFFDEELRELGKKSLEKKLIETSRFMIWGVRNLSETEIEKILPREEDILRYDLMKGRMPDPNKDKEKIHNEVVLDRFLWDRLVYLKEIGVLAAKLGIDDIMYGLVITLQEIGSKILDREMGDLMRRDIYKSLMGNVEEVCFEGNRNHLRHHLLALSVFGIVASDEKKKGRRDIVSIITYHFSRVYLHAVENGICDFMIINDLGTLGRTLVPDFEEETLFIIDAIGKIGTILLEKENKEPFPLEKEVIQRNINFAKEALESIKIWNKHTNNKIISRAESWIEKLGK